MRLLYAPQVRGIALEKEKTMVESRAREQISNERTRLAAAADEARREAAVQKALAEGWSRDLKVRHMHTAHAA